jgi:hypothetical protein
MKPMMRYEDLPPHLRPYDRPPRPYEELPLEELPPAPDMGSPGGRHEEPPPADPFLRR